MSNSTKIIAFLENAFPTWGLSRAKSRHDRRVIASYGGGRGYAGGNASRMRKSAAYHRSYDMDEDSLCSQGAVTLILEAMDLYRNNPLCKSGVNAVCDYLGESRPLSCASATATDSVEGKAFEAEANDYFMNGFWNAADYRRRPGITFGNFQRFVTMAEWLQGDMLYVWKGNGFIPVEGLRIATPSTIKDVSMITRGIRRNASGRITHFYVCNRTQDGSVDTTNFVRIPANACIYTPWYWRPDQLRGVPRLHGVIDQLRDHDEIHDYTKAKIKYESMMVSKEKAGSTITGPGTSFSTNAAGVATEVNQVDWGMQFKVHGDVDDFALIRSESPNAQYVPTMEYDGKLIAAGMGMPYEILMHIYTQGSYTAQRAARVDFKNLLMREWAWRNHVFNQRVWNIVIAQAVRNEYIRPAPVDARGFSTFARVNWSTPYMAEIDQGKEAKADMDQWNIGKTSLHDIAVERGRTRAELLEAKSDDIAAAIAKAEALSTPDNPVTWKDIIATKLPQINQVVEVKEDE